MPQILEHIWQMKAPQIVLWGLFLFQRHRIGKPYGWGTGDGGGVLTGPDGNPNPARLVSSSGTPHSVWTLGL